MSARPLTRSILMIGDSLTRGFDPSNNTYPPWTLYMLLAKRYQSVGAAVVNAAGSAYNTRMMKRVLPDIQTQCQATCLQPKLVTLWSGANDCILPFTRSRTQHVPLEEYKQNINDIVSFIHKKWPRARILLITPPPSIPEKWLDEMTLQWRLDGEEGPEPEQDRTLEHTKRYVDACIEVGRGLDGIHVINAWDIIVKKAGGMNAELLGELVPDGLHLSAKGHELLYNEVERVIKTNMTEWDPARMDSQEVKVPSPLILPNWIDLVRTPPQTTVPLPVDV